MEKKESMNILEEYLLTNSQNSKNEVTRLQNGVTNLNNIEKLCYLSVTSCYFVTPDQIKPCHLCGSLKFWRMTGVNKWICPVCHPPAIKKNEVEYFSLQV